MKLRTSLKNNKYILMFLCTLFVIGIIFGIIYFIKQPSIVKSAIGTEMDMFKELIKTTKQNQVLYHLLILVIIFFLNFTVIGFLANIFYLFYEGCSLGFSIALFTYKYKISGIIFGLIFNIITKSFFLILIGYIGFLGIKIVKKTIGSVVLKQNNLNYIFLKKHILIFFIIIGVSLFSDLILYLWGNSFLKLFLFLI